MQISLDELRVQIALGSIDAEVRSRIWEIEDGKALSLLSRCADVAIRKAVAINPNTPFSVIKKFYTSDPDIVVRECAWERVASRLMRRYNLSFLPPLPREEPDLSNLPDNVNVYKS